ncbi:3-deoxy-manno-octulosonate cytidylyltransferase [Deltaproteobacteria bacterium]|nr:3-deoxy-manno-octulosonate cytidylyltransferase [Deltaproteobacteria bacterium]
MFALNDEVIVGIPARRGSTRLANKMLADLCGAPVIVRTWQRVREAGFERVFVATDDEEIASVVRAAGGQALMTGEAANGTARIAQAFAESRTKIVLNVQGDEPLVAIETLHEVAGTLLDKTRPAVAIATAAAPLDPAEAERPERVKVVTALDGQALYFSRSAIPWGGPYRVHVGVYAFHRTALRLVASLDPSPIDEGERLEQLRWMAHRVGIRVVDVAAPAPSVDTQADLDRVRAIFASQHPSAVGMG